MSNSDPEKPPDLVPHPRYGDRVIPSRHVFGERVDPSRRKASGEMIRDSFWGYAGEIIFPESAIRADLSRQSYSVVSRRFYVDMLKQCRACRRPFLFFAMEQQHWYEVLGFKIDADCVRCPECRRVDRRLRRAHTRYSRLVGRAELSDDELAGLVLDAVNLFEAGVLRDEQKLRRIKNLALTRLPGSPATASLTRVIAEVSASQGKGIGFQVRKDLERPPGGRLG